MSKYSLEEIIDRLKKELLSNKLPEIVKKKKEEKLGRYLGLNVKEGVRCIGIYDNEIFIGDIYTNSFGKEVGFFNTRIGHTWEMAQGLIHRQREKECDFLEFSTKWFEYIYKSVVIDSEEFIKVYEKYFDDKIKLIHIPKKNINSSSLEGLGFKREGSKYEIGKYCIEYTGINWKLNGKIVEFMEDLL